MINGSRVTLVIPCLNEAAGLRAREIPIRDQRRIGTSTLMSLRDGWVTFGT